MIHRLLHFAVDPNLTSKELNIHLFFSPPLALKVIKKLKERFPIKRAPLRSRLKSGMLINVISKDESGSQPSVVCEIEPSILRSCEEKLKDVQGRVEVLSVSAHAEGGSSVDQYEKAEESQSVPTVVQTDPVTQIGEAMQKQSISSETGNLGQGQGKQQRRCKECDVLVEDKLYREHCKSGWHKHNYTRHKNGLSPLSQEECLA
uniref:Ribosome maturation protein SDO1/SBDS C-terminal domain-containing protein n=1 Tax=Leersia perrieri TaxID=77586 RepID=A0A0D9X3L3_9ORYZ